VATLRRGEVWWAERPDRNPRPVVVLTRDDVLALLRYPMVAMVTTVVRDVPTEVDLDRSDGMPRPCVVSLDNVQTIARAHLIERITSLSSPRMSQVCEAMRVATGC
jgi:mRNA interferase MazF